MAFWQAGPYDGVIVAVSHDNTDDAQIPFSQVTVRVADLAQDVCLAGSEIRFYLRRVTAEPQHVVELRRTVREFQDASMIEKRPGHEDEITPAHLRQFLQDLGDEQDRLRKQLLAADERNNLLASTFECLDETQANTQARLDETSRLLDLAMRCVAQPRADEPHVQKLFDDYRALFDADVKVEIVEPSPEDKSQRILPNVKFTARLRGMIHHGVEDAIREYAEQVACECASDTDQEHAGFCPARTI